jgi:hypothetical protein
MAHFKKESILKMFRLIKDSDSANKEHGSLICLDTQKNELSLGTPCIGKECSIEYLDEKDCGIYKKVGTYHTHAGATTIIPSLTDLVSKDRISCIGAKNKIECFIPTTDKKKWLREHIDKVKRYMEMDLNNKPLDFNEERDYRKFVDNIIKENFKIAKIKFE